MSSNNNKRNYQWTSLQENKLLDGMALCVNDKLTTNVVFCNKGWARITCEMCDKDGLEFDRTRIKNRHRTLKTNYANIKKIIRESEFRWIEYRRMTNNTTFYKKYLLCNIRPYVDFAWLFYYRDTSGH
ncbi:hypothetical protein AMTRI_Chr06g196740 [Amborella trichopoda]